MNKKRKIFHNNENHDFKEEESLFELFVHENVKSLENFVVVDFMK